MSQSQLLSQISRGLGYHKRGLKWLKSYPKIDHAMNKFMKPLYLGYWILIGCSVLLFILSLSAGVLALSSKSSTGAAVSFAGIMALIPICFGCSLAMIIYYFYNINVLDRISNAVEKTARGTCVEPRTSQRLLTIRIEELRKVGCLILVGVFINIIVSIFASIPLIGSLLVLIIYLIQPLFTGWMFFDYPLARNGFTFKERIEFAAKYPGLLWAIGLPLIVPILQIFYLPRTFVAASALASRELKKSDPPAVEIPNEELETPT